MKKKNRKLPMIGVMGYLTLDELFEQLYEYIEDNIGSDGDYKEIAEYLWRLGEGGEWKLEIAYSSWLPRGLRIYFRTHIAN